jgi:hypothetical protein
MTLILSLLTPWYVVQVADRRLTFVQTGRVAPHKTNKIVLFKNQMAFGYTGLADLGGGTDGWLAKTFFDGPPDLDGAVENLETKAADALSSVNLPPKHKIHAFGGVGWAEDGDDLIPTFVRVSNFFREGKRLEEASHSFNIDVYLCGSEQLRFFDTGVRVTTEEKKWINRRLRRAVVSEHSPWTCARILVESIRQVAKRNSLVGRDLLVVIIPKAAAKSDQIGTRSRAGPFEVISGCLPVREDNALPDPDEVPLVLDIPANSNEGIRRGPAFVIPGMVISSGSQYRNLSSEEFNDPSKVWVPEIPPGYT